VPLATLLTAFSAIHAEEVVTKQWFEEMSAGRRHYTDYFRGEKKVLRKMEAPDEAKAQNISRIAAYYVLAPEIKPQPVASVMIAGTRVLKSAAVPNIPEFTSIYWFDKDGDGRDDVLRIEKLADGQSTLLEAYTVAASGGLQPMSEAKLAAERESLKKENG